MAQVKLNLNRLSAEEKLQLATEIDAALTGNALFTTPNPPLSVLAANIATLQSALTSQNAAQHAAVMATLNLRGSELQLDNTLTALAAYVQNASGGAEASILSAGMGVRSTGGKVGPLPAPQALSGTNGDLPGEIDLHWNPVHGAMSYVLRQTTDPITPASVWTTLPPTTRSKATVPGLTPGTRYWFQVAAVGAAGQGPWSDPATKMAQG